MQQLFDEYLPYCKAHRSARTYKDARLHIESFLSPYFGSMTASDVSTKHVESFISSMQKWTDRKGNQHDYHPRTINLRLETLRKILKRAVDNKDVPEMPCKITLLKEPKSLPRYAYPQELIEWMKYLDRDHRLRALLSLSTGISDRDLGFMMLDGYDPHNRMLRYRRPKSNTDIVVPLNNTAMQIMHILVEKNPGPELFPAESVKKAYYEASKASVKKGGKNITPHMLRHSFATMLLSQGVPLAHVKTLLGHSSAQTTERYAKVLPEYLRAAVDKIEYPMLDLQSILSAPRAQTVHSKKAGKKSSA